MKGCEMPEHIWTDEAIEAFRKRWDGGNGETLEEIGASLTPPLTRQRVGALLKRKPRKPREKRATISVSLSADLDKWLLRQATRHNVKKAAILRRLVEQAASVEEA
jgi:hypothetical protein